MPNMSRIEGLQKTISALRGQRRDLINYLREYGSLADKARLIDRQIWKCPAFNRSGLVTNVGWEEEDYSPSRAVFSKEDGPEIFADLLPADRADPEVLKLGLEFWGDEFYSSLNEYDFEGYGDED